MLPEEAENKLLLAQRVLGTEMPYRMLPEVFAPSGGIKILEGIIHRPPKYQEKYLAQELSLLEKLWALVGGEGGLDLVVVDIGANIGLFSLFVNDICPDAEIFSFEPVAPVYQSLKYNTEKHGRNIKTYPYGISDREKSQVISFYPNNTVMSGSYGNVEEDKDLVRQFMLNQSMQHPGRLGQVCVK